MDFEVHSEILEERAPVSVVVIGAGGGGSNAVDRMVECGIKGIKFIAVNTDIQALKRNKAELKLQIGAQLTEGMGAGGNPEVGENAALEDKEKIAKALEGASMVFVTAGMGGGTGTGSAPVIADIAKKMGALTVGVVTKPFDFERSYRMELAEEGIAKLKEKVDSLIVIPNQKLLHNVDRKTSIPEAFRKVDDILRQAVQGISDGILETGIINIDFADVKAVMKEQGDALMTIGYGDGETRIEEAVSKALDNPLLEDTSIRGATRALVYVAGSEELPILEYQELVERITNDMDENVKITIGTYLDQSLQDKIRVTVIATGFNPGKEETPKADPLRPVKGEIISTSEFNTFVGEGIVSDSIPPRNIRDEYKYTNEDLDVPTVIRDRRFISFISNAQAKAQSE